MSEKGRGGEVRAIALKIQITYYCTTAHIRKVIGTDDQISRHASGIANERRVQDSQVSMSKGPELFWNLFLCVYASFGRREIPNVVAQSKYTG